MENELLQCHQWILKFWLLTDWHFELLGGVPVKKPPCICKRVFMSNWMNLEHFRPVQWNVFVPPPTKFRQKCPPKRVLATMLISWQKCENRVQIVRMWTMNNYKGPALRRHIWVKFQNVWSTFWPQKAQNCDIYLICDKSAYAASQMCLFRQLCASNHGCRGWQVIGLGNSDQISFNKNKFMTEIASQVVI